MGKRIKRFLPLLVFGLFSPIPVLAQVEGPVETGLAQLAQQIVTKSAAAGKTTVAVLPFPNVDGSCSVLSNFIADELIQSLFSVPGSKLDIVERAQLETIINELKLGASGLLNPETTKRLGSQSGVSALIVGTITVIGDTVRINARLIATDTGKAISAAAVDIPKVAAVSELLKQPISSGPTCSPQRAGPAPAATTSQSPEPGQRAGGTPPTEASLPQGYFYYEDFSEVPKGNIPAGWIGGDALGVVAKSSGNELTNFQDGVLDIQTAKIPFPQAYDLEIVFWWSYGWMRISFGKLEIIMRDSGNIDIANSHIDVGRRLEKDLHTLLFHKRGNVFSFDLDNKEFLVSRYKDIDANSISFSNRDIPYATPSFGIRRIAGKAV